jgi:BMFP domain-containing protein YqiC
MARGLIGRLSSSIERRCGAEDRVGADVVGTSRASQGKSGEALNPAQRGAILRARARPPRRLGAAKDRLMTQTTNRLMDELAKLMTDAAGAAQGMRREVESVMRAQAERILRGMDIVDREQFEAVKAMVEKARAENERLEARIVSLEAEIARLKGVG